MGPLTQISENGLEAIGRYYSFYPGHVVDNEDPMFANRLKVYVPDVNQGIITWALPSDKSGKGWYYKGPTPRIGDLIYVWFMMGNIQCPRWLPMGHSLITSGIPEELRGNHRIGLFTLNGNQFWINDFTGDVYVKTKGTIHIDSATQIIFNQGQNLGMVKIQELTDKINNLVKELETLRNIFNNHTHTGVQTGPGITAPTSTPDSTAFTPFNKDDYENTKILQ